MPNKNYQTDHLDKDHRPTSERWSLSDQKRRYEKVRNLCKNLNRKRRNLRDKVDLLCKDLVRSNKQLAQTLGELRFLCDFQHEMMGENDLAYLMHKAIQLLTLEIPETSAAIFLSATRKFEAHLSGCWQRQKVDLESVESILLEAVIDVGRKKSSVFLGVSPSSETFAVDVTDHDFPYAMMGLPMIVEGELIGVVVFYRDLKAGFTLQEQARPQSCLSSLGRQIVATQRLHTFLCGKKS